MNDVIKRGSLLPFLQQETWDFDPTRGYLHQEDYKGAGRGAMLSLQQDYVRAGIACRLVYHQGDTASLETDDATQQYTIDSWQMLGNAQSRDGFSHPSVIAAAATAVDPALVFLAMRIGIENGDSFASIESGPFDDMPSDSIALLEREYNRQINGQTEYEHGQYVLVHETNAPARWDVNIADFGVNQNYTTAQLLSEVQDASLWIYPLPDRLAYKIANLSADPFQPFYQWGWVKSRSTEANAANNRINIRTEYVLENWSVDRYPPY